MEHVVCMKRRGGFLRGGERIAADLSRVFEREPKDLAEFSELAHAVVSEIEILPPVMRGAYPRVTTEEIRQAVENQLGYGAVFVYSAPVRDVFGDTLWEGRVHVFLLKGLPGVPQAYAWLSGHGDARRVHVVREGGGIMGPAHAVRAVRMIWDRNEPPFFGCGPDWIPVPSVRGPDSPASWGGRET